MRLPWAAGWKMLPDRLKLHFVTCEDVSNETTSAPTVDTHLDWSAGN